MTDPGRGTDDADGPDTEPTVDPLADEMRDERAPERPVDRFRRSAAGTVVAAGLLGLRDALEGRPEREEPAIVTEAPQRQPSGTVDVVLDFEHPERSRAVLRRPPAPPTD
jgi:hypothetical protein